ncbi:hypothetical protein Tco_0716202 [Tanacetum coccineum]
MVFGKDKSNPLIVDSLLKTIRFSIHLVVYNEELAIPEQTATGKGTSNPLMAVSVELSILATTLNRLERSILNWDLHLSSSISHTPKDFIKEDKGYLKLSLLVFIARDISPKE